MTPTELIASARAMRVAPQRVHPVLMALADALEAAIREKDEARAALDKIIEERIEK